MKTHDLIQGSAPWHAHRLNYFNASDTAAMMGCSKYKTRSQLIQELATGLTADVGASTQRLFDDGHRFEALARPLAEEVIGEDLFPVVGTEGKFSASFDGLTMAEDVAFEHKTLNAELREAMTTFDGAALPLAYRVQMEQQCMVSGCEKVLFMATKWNGDQLVERREAWYMPDLELRALIVAGWAQLEEDVAAYVPDLAPIVEKVIAEPVQSLPAPVIRVTGQLTLSDNFKVFEERLRHFLENQLIREPKTDEDFVNLDAQIKAMKEGREALKSARAQMLAQVEPVDRANKTADMLDTLLQKNCAMAEAMLKSEKDRRRLEIVTGGTAALADHIAGLNKRIGKPYMPAVPADFGGCVKGLKSLASMEDKVATTLSNAKIAANEIGDRIQLNMGTLRDLAGDHAFLFADTATIVLKQPDDCIALVKNRIAEHDKAEADKKAANDLAEQQRKERLDTERTKRITDRITDLTNSLTVYAGQPAKIIQAKRMLINVNEPSEDLYGTRLAEATELRSRVLAALDEQLEAAEQAERDAAAAIQEAAPAPTPAPAPAPVQSSGGGYRRAAPVAEQPTLKLGEIQSAIAPFSITADGLAQLGFPHAATAGAAKLYLPSTLPKIKAAAVTLFSREEVAA